MVQDLELVKTTYRSSLLQLNILTEQEAECMFGDLDQLLRLHAQLRDNLAALRDPSGVVKAIGQVLLHWVSALDAYSYTQHKQIRTVKQEYTVY